MNYIVTYISAFGHRVYRKFISLDAANEYINTVSNGQTKFEILRG